MDEVVYLILVKKKDVFNVIYAGESGKTDALDFFTKNDKFKCWMSNAGSEENTFLAIYPMWKSNPPERKRVVDKIIAQYKPVCNKEN